MYPQSKRIRLESPRRRPSQVTPIEMLFDEVLVEIFSYLEARELKNSALVCKNWNEVIETSAVTMKKFKLALKQLPIDQFISTRYHQNIELLLCAKSEGESTDNLKRHFMFSQAKNFKIIMGYNSSVNYLELTSVLEAMPLLQELFIESDGVISDNFNSKVDLPKLKQLTVLLPDAKFFQCITARNLTQLVLSTEDENYFEHDSIENVQHLASFLEDCEKITTLKINSYIFEDLFTNNKWKDFHLKLSTFHISVFKELDTAALREFLRSQAPSLTSLGIDDDWDKLPTDFIGAILRHLTNLKCLNYAGLCESDESFLRYLPKLESLTLSIVKDINSIARFNRKLTYLKVFALENSIDAGLKFAELKHFVIEWDDSETFWLDVIKNSPIIETVEIKMYDGAEESNFEDIVRVLLEKPSLRHLKFSNDCSFCLKKLFEIISSNYGNLKSLSMCGLGFDCAWKTIEFLFPTNRSEWDAEAQKMLLEKSFL